MLGTGLRLGLSAAAVGESTQCSAREVPQATSTPQSQGAMVLATWKAAIDATEQATFSAGAARDAGTASSCETESSSLFMPVVNLSDRTVEPQ